MSDSERKSEVRLVLDQIEKWVVLSTVLIVFLTALGLMFVQQMVAAEGQAGDFYAFFGNINIAGFMMAVPVTIGLALQTWRLNLYKRGILSGQWPDYVFTILLILIALATDVYVFNASPVRPIGPNAPRIVISSWVVLHVLQVILEAVTDSTSKANAAERKEGRESASGQPSFLTNTNHRERAREAAREPVSPKES